MAKCREVEVAMTLLSQHDKYWLQLRDGPASIGAAGLIDCFGGRRKPHETYAQAATRELAEGTNLRVEPRQLMAIGRVAVPSDMEHKSVAIRAEVFVYDVPAHLRIEATAGMLMDIPKPELREYEHKLTPATWAMAFELLGEWIG